VASQERGEAPSCLLTPCNKEVLFVTREQIGAFLGRTGVGKSYTGGGEPFYRKPPAASFEPGLAQAVEEVVDPGLVLVQSLHRGSNCGEVRVKFP
jgi:hypothetical protein